MNPGKLTFDKRLKMAAEKKAPAGASAPPVAAKKRKPHAKGK